MEASLVILMGNCIELEFILLKILVLFYFISFS